MRSDNSIHPGITTAARNLGKVVRHSTRPGYLYDVHERGQGGDFVCSIGKEGHFNAHLLLDEVKKGNITQEDAERHILKIWSTRAYYKAEPYTKHWFEGQILWKV